MLVLKLGNHTCMLLCTVDTVCMIGSFLPVPVC